MSDLLQMIRGDTFAFTRTVTDENGPVDLSTADITFTAKRNFGDLVPFLRKTLDDGIDLGGSGDIGELTVTIEPEDTTSLTHTDRFVWDIEVKDEGDLVRTPFMGRLVVRMDVLGILSVEDHMAYGELTITDNATPMTLTLEDTWYKVTDGWFADQHSNVTLDELAGTLTPLVSGQYATMCTVAFISDELEQVEFGLFRDGTLIPDHLALSWVDTADFPNTITITGIDPIASGGVIDLRVKCSSKAGLVLTVVGCNLSVFTIQAPVAAHVDPSSGTVADVVNALMVAGLMAP